MAANALPGPSAFAPCRSHRPSAYPDAATLGRLEWHQQQILATMARAVALLDAAVPDAFALASLRWQATRELRGYQLFKHRELFDPVIAREGSAGVIARSLKRRCVLLGDRVTAHVAFWSTADVMARWPEYRDAARALLAAVTQHMADERTAAARLCR